MGTLVVRGRLAIVAAWFVASAIAFLTLPEIVASGGAGLRGLVPQDSTAVQAEIRDLEAFGFPLISRTIVVQRDPDGLSEFAQARTVLRAINLTRGEYPELRDVAGALPITNAFGLIDAEGAKGDTALTLLFFRPEIGVSERERLAERFVADHMDPELDSPVGITGTVPGRLEQGRVVKAHLPAVELFTVLLILAIVGIHFRSVGASLLALTAAGMAYLLSLRLIAFVLRSTGLGLPEELEPLIVVLLLGVVTDYSIFFLDHARESFRRGEAPHTAVVGAVSEIAPIVGTAGLAVALGTAALIVARLDTFRALGPGMALTVLLGVAVSVTFVPAVIALAGRWLFWPSLKHTPADPQPTQRLERRRRAMRRLTERRTAIVVSIAGVLVLATLSAGIATIHLGFSIVGALPPDSPPRRAAAAAAAGFAEGVISPTTLLIESRTATGLRLDSLVDLQRRIEDRSGIAGAIGAGDFDALASLLSRLPPRAVSRLPDSPDRLVLRAVFASDRSAARILIVLDEPPLGGSAVNTFRELRADASTLLRDAGIDPLSVRLSFAGDTALAAETIDQTVDDLVRIVIVVAVLMVLLLGVFLRALVAPLFLVAVSLLAFLAALGLTALISVAFGVRSVSFFVPFASAVLLISLGSDYNIFLVGRVWATARRIPLREAIVEAAPAASRAITVAGVTLAGSFAALALVPLRPLQQFAVAMSVGIVLDTFLVRAIITPAMLAAAGPISGWPGRVWSADRRQSHVYGGPPSGTPATWYLPSDVTDDRSEDQL